MMRRIFPLFIVLLLSACSTVERISPQQQVKLANTPLAEIKNWQVKGRIAVKSPARSFSATLRWQQANADYDISVTNFIGAQILTMKQENGVVALEADDKTYRDTDPQRLVQELTGWTLPFSTMPQWMKGVEARADQSYLAQRDDMGRLTGLTAQCWQCVPWRIAYNNYKQEAGHWLPYGITLTRQDEPEFRIKIAVQSWQLGRS